MKLPRFSLRRLMILVGLAGAALGMTASMHRRSATFRVAAARHARLSLELGEVPPSCLDHHQGRPAVNQPLADYHYQLMEKYLAASSHPWLPVEPDLPEPK